jgi:hypothetical protein
VSEDVPWQQLLRETLVVLALPPDEQVRVNGPGCVACDLLEDFDHARTVALGNAPNLSDEQRGLLDRIDAAIQVMEQPDFECFNNEVVRRPVWQQLRERAAEALRVFGWEKVGVRPFVEIQPGVWQRPGINATQGTSPGS